MLPFGLWKTRCRFVAALTVSAFFFTNVIASAPPVFAQVPGTSIGEVKLTELIQPAATFTIPSELGTVQEYSAPKNFSTPFILHIQDAHANPSAQKNIARILEWLNAQRADSGKARDWVVALEGVKGTIHPEYLDFFKDLNEVNNDLVNGLVEKGELTGAEIYGWHLFQKNTSISSLRALTPMRQYRKAMLRTTSSLRGASFATKVPDPLVIASTDADASVLQSGYKETAVIASEAKQSQENIFFGAEEPALYKENLKIYRDFLNQENVIKSAVGTLGKELAKLENNTLTKEAREFLREKRRRKEGNYGNSSVSPQWTAYLGYLKTKLKDRLKLDLEAPFEQVRFPNAVRLCVLSKVDQTLNPEKIKQEQASFFAEFKKQLVSGKGQVQKAKRDLSLKGPEEQLMELLETRPSGVDLRRLAEQLWALSQNRQIRSEDYRLFWLSLGRDILASELDYAGLEQELTQLEQWLEDTLASSANEKRVLQTGRDFELFEKLLSLELSREKLDAFTGSQKEILAYIFSLTANPQIRQTLDPWIHQALRFYDLAQQRDHILLEKTLAAGKGKKTAVLITGGFHTSGFIKQLREQGLGYAVIQPKMTATEGGELYRKVLREENADVSAYFGKPFLTKQEAIFFKTIAENGASVLWDKAHIAHADIAGKVAEAINHHPILSQRFDARSEVVQGSGSQLDFELHSKSSSLCPGCPPEQIGGSASLVGGKQSPTQKEMAVVIALATADSFGELYPEHVESLTDQAIAGEINYEPVGTSVRMRSIGANAGRSTRNRFEQNREEITNGVSGASDVPGNNRGASSQRPQEGEFQHQLDQSRLEASASSPFPLMSKPTMKASAQNKISKILTQMGDAVNRLLASADPNRRVKILSMTRWIKARFSEFKNLVAFMRGTLYKIYLIINNYFGYLHIPVFWNQPIKSSLGTAARSVSRSEMRNKLSPEEETIMEQLRSEEGGAALITEVISPQVTKPRLASIVKAATMLLINLDLDKKLGDRILQLRSVVEKSVHSSDPVIIEALRQMTVVTKVMDDRQKMENKWKQDPRKIYLERQDYADLKDRFGDFKTAEQEFDESERVLSQPDLTPQQYADATVHYLQALKAQDTSILSFEGQGEEGDKGVKIYIEGRQKMDSAIHLEMIEDFQKELDSGVIEEGTYISEFALNELKAHFTTIPAILKATLERISRSEMRKEVPGRKEVRNVGAAGASAGAAFSNSGRTKLPQKEEGMSAAIPQPLGFQSDTSSLSPLIRNPAVAEPNKPTTSTNLPVSGREVKKFEAYPAPSVIEKMLSIIRSIKSFFAEVKNLFFPLSDFIRDILNKIYLIINNYFGYLHIPVFWKQAAKFSPSTSSRPGSSPVTRALLAKLDVLRSEMRTDREAVIAGLTDPIYGTKVKTLKALMESNQPIDETLIPVLMELFRDRRRNIQRRAGQALIKVGRPAVPAMIQGYDTDPDPVFRSNIVETLGGIPSVESMELLIRALNDQDQDLDVVSFAGQSLGRLSRYSKRNAKIEDMAKYKARLSKAVRPLADLLLHKLSDVRSNAAEALANMAEANPEILKSKKKKILDQISIALKLPHNFKEFERHARTIQQILGDGDAGLTERVPNDPLIENYLSSKKGKPSRSAAVSTILRLGGDQAPRARLLFDLAQYETQEKLKNTDQGRRNAALIQAIMTQLSRSELRTGRQSKMEELKGRIRAVLNSPDLHERLNQDQIVELNKNIDKARFGQKTKDELEYILRSYEQSRGKMSRDSSVITGETIEKAKELLRQNAQFSEDKKLTGENWRYLFKWTQRYDEGKVIDFDVLLKLQQILENPRSEVRTEEKQLDELPALLDQFKAAYLFLGHGSKNQYKDIEILKRNLDSIALELNIKHGKGNWLVVFGGDPANEQKPDIGYAMKYLREMHGARLLAIQADEYKKWGVGDHVDYVFYYPTQKDADGKILYGGTDAQNHLLGSSRFYLGKDFVSHGMKGIFTLGGGNIAKQEVIYALQHGMEVKHTSLEAKNPVENAASDHEARLGQLDAWITANAPQTSRVQVRSVFQQLRDQLSKLGKIGALQPLRDLEQGMDLEKVVELYIRAAASYANGKYKEVDPVTLLTDKNSSEGDRWADLVNNIVAAPVGYMSLFQMMGSLEKDQWDIIFTYGAWTLALEKIKETIEEGNAAEITSIYNRMMNEKASRSEMRTSSGGESAKNSREKLRDIRRRAGENEEAAWELFEVLVRSENETLAREQKKLINYENASDFFAQFLSSIPDKVKGDKANRPMALAAQGMRTYLAVLQYQEKKEDVLEILQKSDQPIFESYPDSRSELIIVTKDRPNLTGDIVMPVGINIDRDFTVSQDLGTGLQKMIVLVYELSRNNDALTKEELKDLTKEVQKTLKSVSNLSKEISLTGRGTNDPGVFSGNVAVLQSFDYGVSDVVYDIYAGLKPAVTAQQRKELALKKAEIARQDRAHFQSVIDEHVIPIILTFPETLGIETAQVDEAVTFVKELEQKVLAEEDIYRRHGTAAEYRRSALSTFLRWVALEGRKSGLPKDAIKKIDQAVLQTLKKRFFIYDPGQVSGEGGQENLIKSQIERLDRASEEALSELEKHANGRLRGLIDSVRKMFMPVIRENIRSQSKVAEEAVADVSLKAIRKQQLSTWDKDRANAADYQAIFSRILLKLRGTGNEVRGKVLIAEEASDMILFVRKANIFDLIERLEEFGSSVKMIVSDDPETTLGSHWVQMASNDFNVPTLLLSKGALDTVLRADVLGEPVLVHGDENKVFIRPSDATRARLESETEVYKAVETVALKSASAPAITKHGSGIPIHIRASTERSERIGDAMAQGASGVGLGRTEYLIDVKAPQFVAWLADPSPENRKALIEYFAVPFRDMIQSVVGHDSKQPVTLRTFDNERDKDLGLPNPQELFGPGYYKDPIVGRELLKIELLGMLRAGSNHLEILRILFPTFRNPIDLKKFLGRMDLGVSIDEQKLLDQQAREDVDLMMTVLNEALEEMSLEKPELREKLFQAQRGFMIETQETVNVLDHILENSDFISLGTTDLTISVYRLFENISRDNPEWARYFNEIEPDFLKTIRRILQTVSDWNNTKNKNINIDICGVMAGLDAFLLAMVRDKPANVDISFSRSPQKIAVSKFLIRQIEDGVETQQQAVQVLSDIWKSLRQSPEVLEAMKKIPLVETTSAELTTHDAAETTLYDVNDGVETVTTASSIAHQNSPMGEMIRSYKVQSSQGVHVTPIMDLLAEMNNNFPKVQMYFVRPDRGMEQYDARKPLDVMGLGGEQGLELEVKLVGPVAQLPVLFDFLEKFRDSTTEKNGPGSGELLLVPLQRSEMRLAASDAVDIPRFKAILNEKHATAEASKAALDVVESENLGTMAFSEGERAVAEKAEFIYAHPQTLEEYGRIIRAVLEYAEDNELNLAKVHDIIRRNLGKAAAAIEGTANANYRYLDVVDVSELSENTAYGLAVLTLARPRGDLIRLYVGGDDAVVRSRIEKTRTAYENLLEKLGMPGRMNLELVNISGWGDNHLQKEIVQFSSGKNVKLETAILSSKANFLDGVTAMPKTLRLNRTQINPDQAMILSPALLAQEIGEHTYAVLQMKDELEHLGLSSELAAHFAQMIVEIKALAKAA